MYICPGYVLFFFFILYTWQTNLRKPKNQEGEKLCLRPPQMYHFALVYILGGRYLLVCMSLYVLFSVTNPNWGYILSKIWKIWALIDYFMWYYIDYFMWYYICEWIDVNIGVVCKKMKLWMLISWGIHISIFLWALRYMWKIEHKIMNCMANAYA